MTNNPSELYNYHTHTYRCNHASGTEEDYIKRAIENGVKYMGFSDHVPLKFPNGDESYFRVPVCHGREYCDTIAHLAKKYKDKIDLRIGFEMEYYPEYFDKTVQEALEYGAEYLILGQHFVGAEDKSLTRCISPNESEEDLMQYVSFVVSGMEKGVFSFVAHPDVFNFVGSDKIYKEQMRRICIASRELSVPLEINFLGIRKRRNYPNPAFWKIAGEEKSPVVFGFDSHDVESAFDGASLAVANEMVKELKLNYIGKPNLISIKKQKP